MKVYFLRHGKAEAQETWSGDDRLRPLTPDGKEGMRKEAERLRARGLMPDVIVTSPLTRARQTADVAADGIGAADRLIEDELLAPGFDSERLVKLIDAHPAAKSMMIVGHEPDFSATISKLIGGGRIELKKGGLAHVEIVHRVGDMVFGVLMSLETPRQLTGA